MSVEEPVAGPMASRPHAMPGPARVDPATTGFPANADVSLADVAAQGWSLFEDLVPPVMVLRASALERNLRSMAGYCRRHDVDLAPHGKTTMAPALWERQLRAGAWGISAATPVQARAMFAAGVRRVLVADELVDDAAIAWAAEALGDPGFELACWVDSVEGVSLLRRGLAAAGAPRPLDVLVELGHEGGRTGCRGVEACERVARAAAEAPELRLAGVAGYEGTVCQDRSTACLEAIDGFLQELVRAARTIRPLGEREPFLVSAGGSAYFDRVVEVVRGACGDDAGIRVVLRAGCYLTHDHGHYERLSPLSQQRLLAGSEPRAGSHDPDRGAHPGAFLPAIEVWGSVLSTPEPDVVVIGVGKRDAPSDLDLPRPLRIRGHDGSFRDAGSISVDRLMDQHAICRVHEGSDAAPPRLGELVAFGISHPCTAFDRRRVIPVVDDDGRVVEAVATLF